MKRPPTTIVQAPNIERGWQDYHCHLDRALTFNDDYFAHEGGMSAFIDAPLRRKQIITGILHRGPAYTEASLRDRMRQVIEAKIKAGEVLLNAITDCSDDIDGRAFGVALELRKEYAGDLEINVGAYPIFGFKEFGSKRQEHLESLVPNAQFLVALPERDDHNEIGFDGNLRVMIDLAIKYNLPLQVHTDQTNTANEDGTERLIAGVHWLIKTSQIPVANRPKIWAVHAISPSCYEEVRFERLVQGLKDNNIGVVVCPHAALSMRQMRNCDAPIHNCIARVREFLLAEIEIRLGTDNINDLFMPRPKSVLLDREIDALASAIRFYNDYVLHKLACGQLLNETDRDSLRKSLEGDREAFGLCVR